MPDPLATAVDLPERICACCGASSAALTCPHCGEASWSPPSFTMADVLEAERILTEANKKHEQPPIMRTMGKRPKKSKRSKPSAPAGNTGTTTEEK